jgi:Tol biopolymer transport system component
MASAWYAVSSKGTYFTVGRRESPQSPWKPEITFHDFATGRRTKIADLPTGTSSGIGFSLSPDGRYLLYTQCDRETDDLMLVENFR